MVAPRQARAPHMQLTAATLGDGVEVGIQHVPRQVGDNLANRADARLQQILTPDRPVGHVHRGFGDAVHVDQLR